MLRLALLALLVSACSSDESPDDELADLDAMNGKADGTSSWTLVGTGVAYEQVNTGPAIVIAYGGYTARLTDSASWATELVDAKLGAQDVGHIFAVRGPADASYSGREIANSKLRHLLATLDSTAPIHVVAHSSGSYVAHELFEQLANIGDTATLARIDYHDLDGGGTGLTSSIVEELGSVQFVYARDPAAGYSHNASFEQSLAADYAPKATGFEVTVDSTGCNTGATWCLHDVLVTHRPHDPASYDLALDYTDFTDRPVTDDYF
ncbi:MAG TPA: hypothetical protein VLT45_29975 [Kofleriaceae bacterium]|nr:hypothetical protein [Kofleriaceae bacterium]